MDRHHLYPPTLKCHPITPPPNIMQSSHLSRAEAPGINHREFAGAHPHNPNKNLISVTGREEKKLNKYNSIIMGYLCMGTKKTFQPLKCQTHFFLQIELLRSTVFDRK